LEHFVITSTVGELIKREEWKQFILKVMQKVQGVSEEDMKNLTEEEKEIIITERRVQKRETGHIPRSFL